MYSTRIRTTSFKLEFAGVFIIFILTCILHFLFQYTKIFMFSLVSAINESVWEHVKISFWAALIFALYEYFRFFYLKSNFAFGKALGLLFIPFFIPTAFYGYTYFTTKHYLWVDILISFLAGFFCQLISYLIISSEKKFTRYRMLSYITIIFLAWLFIMFTYYPPDFQIFAVI